jgi:hypothetical protein
MGKYDQASERLPESAVSSPFVMDTVSFAWYRKHCGWENGPTRLPGTTCRVVVPGAEWLAAVVPLYRVRRRVHPAVERSNALMDVW